MTGERTSAASCRKARRCATSRYLPPARLRVAGNDRGLQGVETSRAAKFARRPSACMPRRIWNGSQSARFCSNSRIGSPAAISARGGARRVQFHQGEQSMGFGLVRRDGGQHPAHPKRFMAELGSQQSSPRAAV